VREQKVREEGTQMNGTAGVIEPALTSRKVAGYVKAYRRMQRLKRRYEASVAEVQRRRMAMNGGQLTQAGRLLSEGGVTWR
jgi:hypothetical protein